MPEPRHACPGGCGLLVTYRTLACRDCWQLLPIGYRDAVTAAYANRAANPTRHLRAVAKAVAWYRDDTT